MPAPLHRLPNGAHVDLLLVDHVLPHIGHPGFGGDAVLPCVTVKLRDGTAVVIDGVPDYVTAARWADDLAALVNKAREAQA